ncbi:MazG nucleotide pyrophosphohydrolase domain-containing protein [uncultured Microscilla sp.]|uniref:MazG nucleotide pyrophosphohydrolase domain-containing protein n=1 Tax=uncultured Microscilla sp. TaxID=432653 RepID=UPI002623300E|nr:MazG nucleotide pyrophosphohydrolase domain-containing protein [uncultured Microscilla sp.]
MAHLKDKPTLADLQQYMDAVCTERGWNKNNPLETFLLFSEEVGELAKAIRNQRGLYQEEAKAHQKPSSTKQALEEEFADVLGYIFDLANHFEVDLEKAFRAKEAINEQRDWGKSK